MPNLHRELGPLSSDTGAWSRIQEIFSAAVDLRTEDREVVLSHLCDGDAAIRTEVERLLLFNDRTDGPLDRGLAQLTGDCSEAGFAPGDLVCGRFLIVRFIGKGGMGEVFEAEDPVMGENIAIKTIRPEIATEAGLVERLRREVHISRQVSHPNVCRVSELWEHLGPAGARTPFLTMELLKGETAAQRIGSRGPFSPEDALPLIRQIAEGLNEVHRTGIVHRDLKPSNIYLVERPDGSIRVVVTDFGLARPVNPDEYSKTQTGLVFGTPAYMAPEQFESGEATFASDIYSFGVTILEMITGRKHPLMAPSSVVKGIGSSWDDALEQCLRPDPSQRPKSAVEVTELIERPSRRRRLLKPVLALSAAAMLVAAVTYETTRPTPDPQYRLTKVTADEGLSWQPSLSADGKTLAYSSDATMRGDLDIWVRSLDSASPRRITDDPANDWGPSISPDGLRVVYNSDREPKGIYVRNVSGGPERLLSSFGRNASFSPNGAEILFWAGNDGQFTGNKGRIFVANAAGGPARQLAADFLDARNPVWSLTGDEILFEGCGPGCSDPETQRDWWTIRKDGVHPAATGALRQALLQGLALYFDAPAWRNGSVYFSARMTNDTNIWRISPRPSIFGSRWKASPIMSSTEEAIHPSVIGDGSIAFAGLSSKTNLWLAPLNGHDAPRRLSSNIEIDSSPSLSRDGNRILYFRRLGNERRMILRETDGREILNVPEPAGTRGLVGTSGAIIMYTKPQGRLRDLYERRAPTWSEVLLHRNAGELVDIEGDGSAVLVALQTGIATLDPRSGSTTVILRNSDLVFDRATISPRGEWIAYLGNRDSEHAQLFVAPFGSGAADMAHARAITKAEYWYDKPRWTADGRAVIYISDQDGFTCIWKQPFSPATGSIGQPQAIVHFHQIRLSPAHLSRMAFNLSVSRNSVLYNAGEQRSNVWIARPVF